MVDCLQEKYVQIFIFSDKYFYGKKISVIFTFIFLIRFVIDI